MWGVGCRVFRDLQNTRKACNTMKGMKAVMGSSELQVGLRMSDFVGGGGGVTASEEAELFARRRSQSKP